MRPLTGNAVHGSYNVRYVGTFHRAGGLHGNKAYLTSTCFCADGLVGDAIETVRMLLELEDPERVDVNRAKVPPLVVAITHGNLELVQTLIHERTHRDPICLFH